MTMTERGKKLCDKSGVSRRQALKIGARGIGLGLLGGVSPLPPLFGATSEALAATPGKIQKSVIVVYMSGGQSHQDTFDPKPKLNEMAGQSLPKSVLDKARFAFPLEPGIAYQ